MLHYDDMKMENIVLCQTFKLEKFACFKTQYSGLGSNIDLSYTKLS